MIPCISCGKEVSKEAKACPQCGQPWPKDGLNPLFKLTKIILHDLVVILLNLLGPIKAIFILVVSFSLLGLLGIYDFGIFLIHTFVFSVVVAAPLYLLIILIILFNGSYDRLIGIFIHRVALRLMAAIYLVGVPLSIYYAPLLQFK